MIVMINGAFGVGKTSVAQKLVDKIPNSMIYDPEEVGVMLKNIIPNNMKTGNEDTDDFQDLDMWRKLVVRVGEELISKYKKTLIVPMTIKRMEYFNYIYSGFKAVDEQVLHYCLGASLSIIQNRLKSRGDCIGTWPYDKSIKCVDIFEKMFSKDYIDTDNNSIDEVVDIVYKKIVNTNDKYFLSEFLGQRLYTIKAQELDLTAINSSHQRIRQIIRKKPYYEVIIENNPLIIQQQLDIGDLNRYLKQTGNTQLDSIEVNNIIKTIVNDEKIENKIIKKVLNFTRTIKDIDKKYECTSIFITLMRSIGIPCKFILGRAYEKNNHSWAEVFIKEQGWIPVETEKNGSEDDIENWYFGVTNKHVKILEGVDYESMDLKISSINLEVKLIN